MFRSTRPLLVLDEMRIPYQVLRPRTAPAAVAHLSPLPRLEPVGGGGAALYWIAPERSEEWARDVSVGRHVLHTPDPIPLMGALTRAEVLEGMLGPLPGWRPAEPVTSWEGRPVANVWRHPDGSALLPFDPNAATWMLRTEAYHFLDRSARQSLVGLTRRAYYRVRPIVPRSVQIALRRRFSQSQAESDFPRWPAEPALHDLQDWLLGIVSSLVEEPVPMIAVWPEAYRWAMVLTHDVETEVGRDHIDALRVLEEARTFRSSWNFVPRRYRVDDTVVNGLWASGHEVGVHGLYHDGRDVASRRMLRQRLPAMRQVAHRWGASGFRSPATNREWHLMPLLGFGYDSSYPDTDPYEAMPGGCCTWLPFFNRSLVELPITMPQDFILFDILGQDEAAWIDKANLLRRRGGMALLITHPDYMLEDRRRQVYDTFLATFQDDSTAWRALPGDVAAWWRRRATSRLALVDGRWEIEGEAASDGAVTFLRPGTVRSLPVGGHRMAGSGTAMTVSPARTL